ncbi:hypothetical protein [Streptomyces sp. NPDC093094]|uniref:hypothetical protein n=1 Tax=Streptomyces sp. NPDC093094 TaxID=3366026 RepID=UPI003800BE2E
MTTTHPLVLAGQLDDLGDGWITMVEDWATKGLAAGLLAIVVIVMIQKVSLKAGIGALLLMIIALGLYNSRNDLADMFEDEVNNPANGAPTHPATLQPEPAARSSEMPGAGGVL